MTLNINGTEVFDTIHRLTSDSVRFIGNHILPDEDLAAFHWSLLGPEHPLASLKVNYFLLNHYTVKQMQE